MTNQKLLDEGVLMTATDPRDWSDYDAKMHLQEAIAKGGNMFAMDDHGNNILHLKCSNEPYENVRYVLYVRYAVELGVDVNARNVYGRTPIFFGRYRDILLEAGAQVNIRDATNKTPLMYALSESIWYNHKLIIEKMVDVDETDDTGSTALMYAMNFRFVIVDTIKALLARGASITLKNHAGLSAYDMLVRRMNMSPYEYNLTFPHHYYRNYKYVLDRPHLRKEIYPLFTKLQDYNHKSYERRQTLFDYMYDGSVFSKDVCKIVAEYGVMTQSEWFEVNASMCVIL